MTFGKKVRDRRKVLGMTQSELAKKIGVCRDTVMHYEDDTHVPRTKERRQRLAEVLQIPYNDLFREDDRIDQREIGLDWEMLRNVLRNENLPRNEQLAQARLWKKMLRYLIDDTVRLSPSDQRETLETLVLISRIDGIPCDIPRIVTGGGNL